MSLTFAQIANVIGRIPQLSHVSLMQVVMFMDCCIELRDDFALVQPAKRNTIDEAPPTIPRPHIRWLSTVTRITIENLEYLWLLLKDSIWVMPRSWERQQDLASMFEETGWELKLPLVSIYPPARVCDSDGCQKKSEMRTQTIGEAVAFTMDFGVQYAKVVNLTCECEFSRSKCCHSFNASTRKYHKQIPEWIQVDEHHYVET
ncbi:hypothetical protein CONPUDRAFT_63232 [Coniophora puteana RWD-64-598 SS2]|uniref:CxC5 like cysteine cluster associated with KDZ domain-containing protein n=1 Tax=Coniophora puteana (strain RWD-64-598) TaxID=741705 RepID=A0A5M3MC01_CONPW|nr:uncharacterized protein CONPUDRAFT_63232 [Coniophora puteana RWD-64-598 SS2]EIW76752.1 hypothetical protein CONPUDRAFT_63232 [Coniophora puteana RWD-64-598 SS2]